MAKGNGPATLEKEVDTITNGTKRRGSGRPRGKGALAHLPVTFGTYSVGKKTIRLSCKIDRSSLKAETAEEYFLDRRLTGKLSAKPEGWSENQDALPGMEATTEVRAVFDVNGYRASSDQFSIGMSFSRSDLSDSSKALLQDFSNRAGAIEIEGVEDMPEDAKKADGDQDEKE